MMPAHYHDTQRSLAIVHRHAALVPQLAAAASAPDAETELTRVRAQLRRTVEIAAPDLFAAPDRLPQRRVA